MTICSGCFETLKTVSVLLEEDKEYLEKINGILQKIGYKYTGKTKEELQEEFEGL